MPEEEHGVPPLNIIQVQTMETKASIEFGKIEIVAITESKFNQDKHEVVVQLKQSVKRLSNTRLGSLSALGSIKGKLKSNTFDNTRHCLLILQGVEDIPALQKELQADIDAMPVGQARIVHVEALVPIITPAQKAAIEKGFTDKDTIAKSQIVRYKDENGVERIYTKQFGDHICPVYRVAYLDTDGAEDQIMTDKLPASGGYIPQSILAELSVQNQLSIAANA